MIEKQNSNYTQQPVVMEYVTDQLIKQVYSEITLQSSNREEPLLLFQTHALLKTTAKNYIAQTQRRLILEPIAQQIRHNASSRTAVIQQIQAILSQLRQENSHLSGYAGGNLINLCHCLQIDLTGYDFSDLKIWHADLQKVNLHQVNFAKCDLSKSAFNQTFGGILCIAFSPDGKLLATGDTNGDVWLWDIGLTQPILKCDGHSNCVRSVSFSPDGYTLASGSDDQTVKLWDTHTGYCLNTLQEFENWVSSVAWSPNQPVLATGSGDRTVKLWDIHTGECLMTLQGHTDWVHSVAWSPDGKTIASGGGDRTVKLWNTCTDESLNNLAGHTDAVSSLAWSQNRRILASSSDDKTVRLWDTRTGQCLNTLQGHTNVVCSLTWSSDEYTLITEAQKFTLKALGAVEADYKPSKKSTTFSSWKSLIAVFVEAYDEVTVNQILDYIQPNAPHHSKADQMTVSEILRFLGWQKSNKNKRINGVPTPYWFRPC